MTPITRLGAVVCAITLLAGACSADEPDASAGPTTTALQPLTFKMSDEVFEHPAGETIQIDITDHCRESFSLIYDLRSLKQPVGSKSWALVKGTASGAAISRILYIPVPTVFPPDLYEFKIGCVNGNQTENWRNFRVDIINTGIEPPTLPTGQQAVLDQHKLTIDLAGTSFDDLLETVHVGIRGTGETEWVISHSVQPPTADIDNVILIVDIPEHLHGPFILTIGDPRENNNQTFNLQLK